MKNQIKKIDELEKINPDYFVICSDTFKHYEQLNYINNNFENNMEIELLNINLYNIYFAIV